MSKIREALEEVVSILSTWTDHLPPVIQEEVQEAIDKAEAALGEPVCNCEVGTPEEQNLRHGEWCRKYGIDGTMDVPCASPDMHCHLCFARWSQMPYKKEGEE
jgi:hypothetical protein